MQPVTVISKIPNGARSRCWTLRDDNRGHYHAVVSLSESPLYLTLSWRVNAHSPVVFAGHYILDLHSLLRGGYIRNEPKHSKGNDVRVRIIRSDGGFYIQANNVGPKIKMT